MAVQKIGAPGHRGVLVWFLALTTLYHVAYQFFTWYTHPSEWHQDVCMNTGKNSPQCLDQTFRDPQREADMEQQGGEDIFGDLVTPPETEASNMNGDESGVVSSSPMASAAADITNIIDVQDTSAKLNEASRAILDSLDHSSVQPFAQSLASLQTRMEARYNRLPSSLEKQKLRRAEFDRLYDETFKLIHANRSNTWGQSMLDFQARMDAWYVRLPSRRMKLGLDPVIADGNSVTPWAQSLSDTEVHLQAQHELIRYRQWERRTKFDKLYAQTLDAVNSSETVTPWAKGVDALQSQLQARMQRLQKRSPVPFTKAMSSFEDDIFNYGRELCEHPRRHGLPACAQFLADAPSDGQRGATKLVLARNKAIEGPSLLKERLRALQENQERWEKQFVADGFAAGRALCADISRRNASSCAQFRSREDGREILKNHRLDLSESRQAWEHDIQEQANRLGQQLCADPRRRNEPSCAQFFSKTIHDGQMSETSQESLEERAQRFGRELCAEPRRRNEPSCTQFHSATIREGEPQTIADSPAPGTWGAQVLALHMRMAERMDQRASRQRQRRQNLTRLSKRRFGPPSWEQSFIEQINDIGRELCEKPWRRNDPSCARFY